MSSRLEGGLSIGANLVFYGLRALAGLCALAVLAGATSLVSNGLDSMTPVEFWVPSVFWAAVAFGLYKASNWFRRTSSSKLEQHSQRLASIEVAIGTKVDRELTARKTATDSRRALQEQMRARPRLGILKVTVLGGAGWETQANEVLHLTADESTLYLANSRTIQETSIPLSQLSKVEIAGPGTFTSGGGFGGGGFGVEGFALGAAAASVLNALTTRTKTETVVYLRFKDSELVLLSGELGLEEMRIRLSPIYVRVDAPSASQNSAADVAGQLARLAELKAQGALSEDEYKLAKARVLAPQA